MPGFQGKIQISAVFGVATDFQGPEGPWIAVSSGLWLFSVGHMSFQTAQSGLPDRL